MELYRPSFFERVGLRYINEFKRSTLDLRDVAWTELIQPFALGFMSNSDISNDVRNLNLSVELNINNGAIAQINTAKGFARDAIGLPVLGGEETFIVDGDMYMLHKNTGEVHSSLTYLHDYSTKLIRSIITDKLHSAMEPSEL